MSGGHYNYFYFKLKEFDNKMQDKELNALIYDLSSLFKDLEWYESGDIYLEEYQNSIKEFKSKWFKNRDIRLTSIINEACENLRLELLKMIE